MISDEAYQKLLNPSFDPMGDMIRGQAEISELKAALAKTTDENLELVEKCEKLKKELSLSESLNKEQGEKLSKVRRLNGILETRVLNYRKENKLHKKVCENLNNDLFDLHNKYESKLRRQKELIRSLKKQRRYLVKSRSYWILEKRRETAHNYFLSKEKRIDNENLNQTILDLNKQIGEMRVKLANTVTKMKEKQIESGSETFNAIKDAATQSILQSLCKARKINWYEAIQCGLKANLPERPANENIVSNHKYNITVNGRRI